MPAPYIHLIHGDWVGLEKILQDLSGILNVDTTFSDILTPPGSDGEVIYNKDSVYGADSTFSFDDVTKVLTAKVLKITTVAASVVDTDKFLVDDSDEIKFRTGAELLSDIGGSAVGHLHDTQTLQHDAVNSDGGAFAFTTTGLVTFNQSIAAANYAAANLLTAAATNAGALDFSAASKTLTVEDNAIVSQDYTSDAAPTFGALTLSGSATYGIDLSGGTWSTGVLNLDQPFDMFSNGTRCMYFNDASSIAVFGMGDAGNIGSITSASQIMAIGSKSLRDLTSGNNLVGIGTLALHKATSAKNCIVIAGSTPITNGQNDIAIGVQSLGNVSSNVLRATAIGSSAGRYSGNDTVSIGEQANRGDVGGGFARTIGVGAFSGFSNLTGDDCIFLGYKGGYNQTGVSDLLIIDNQDRGSIAAEITDCLIYGVMNATPASQTIRFNASVGIHSTATIPLDVYAKSGMTSIGGIAIKLTNKTGGNTVAGELVRASFPPLGADTDDAFETADADSQEVIGITLEAGVADGSEAWVVVSGIAAVLMDGGGSIRGDRIISSNTAGSADVWNVGGAVATHFQEIGHCIETRGGAGLARCVLHFN